MRAQDAHRFSDLYLFAYRRNERGARVDVVVPSVSRRIGGFTMEAGEYSCPAFLNWLESEVDPLLRAGQAR
jgi:hypothetical protein